MRLRIWRRDGLTRRAIQRKPSGQFPARLIRCVTSAISLSSSTVPSWAMPGFHVSRGELPDRLLVGYLQPQLTLSLTSITSVLTCTDEG